LGATRAMSSSCSRQHRLWFHDVQPRHFTAMLAVLALATACTQSRNTEAPVLQPEPMIEISTLQPREPSIAMGSLDRLHWTARSISPYRGTVVHSAMVNQKSVADSSRSSVFPSETTVLDDGPALAVAAIDWLTAPIAAVWSVARLPVVAIVGESGWSGRSSPQSSYDRLPADHSPAAAGVGFLAPGQSAISN